MSFRRSSSNEHAENDRDDNRYDMETNWPKCSPKRQQISSIICDRWHFSGFESNQPDFSSLEATVNVLSAYQKSNGSTIMSKCDTHHLSRLCTHRYSSDINPCSLWLFGLLKGILKSGRYLEWWNRRDHSNTLEWLDFWRHAEHCIRHNALFWVDYWE
jgi:hypothetical protein